MNLKEFSIGEVVFNEDSTVIIAEAGVNHLGRMDYAEQLIMQAAASGCQIVKFQTYTASKLTTRDAPRFWTWEGELDQQGSQFDSYSMLDSLDLSGYRNLKALCGEYGIEFLSTPFDPGAVDLLMEVGVGGFKLASCDITNKPLLEYVAQTGLPILLSTGASTVEEVSRAVDWIMDSGAGSVLIMHCNLTYPTPDADANLSAITALQEAFPSHLIGYSDHTLGPYIAAASVCFGACAIEKHFTFDKELPLSADHWLSANPEEMRQLVALAEKYSSARGSQQKVVQPSEGLARTNARRSLVAMHDLQEGDVLREEDVAMKRPGTGIPPFALDAVLGKRLVRFIPADTVLNWEDFESID